MSNNTIPSEVNNAICEVAGCFAKAKVSIAVKVGLKERYHYYYVKTADHVSLQSTLNTKNRRCSELTDYDDLLERQEQEQTLIDSTAKEYIPRMYQALRNENSNISPEDARDRIKKIVWNLGQTDNIRSIAR